MSTGYSVQNRESLLRFMTREEIDAFQTATEQLISSNTVGGLASPYLFGRNNNWNQNQYLRAAGSTNVSGAQGYFVGAGSKLVRIQISVGVPAANPVPVEVLLAGASVASLILPGTTATFALDVDVPDSGSGGSTLAVRSGAYAGLRARFPLVSIWSVEP